MKNVDPRLVAAMERQLARRPTGATRVGWKLGSGDGERIAGEIAVGSLTSATVLEDGATYRGGGGALHADAELAVELGADGAIARSATAVEVVDLAGDDPPEEVVATNVWHRAVAFGPFVDRRPAALEGALVVNGERPGGRLITGLIVNTRSRPATRSSPISGRSVAWG